MVPSSTKTINMYDGVFTIGVHDKDTIPRPSYIRRNDTDLVLTGSYHGYYIMCQFPLNEQIDVSHIPTEAQCAEDHPMSEYESYNDKIEVWTGKITYPGYSVIYSKVTVRSKYGEITFQIPYFNGLEIQKVSKGICNGNGIRFH